MDSKRGITIAAAILALIVGHPGVPSPAAATESPTRTPPRLSLIEGEVSFWRPGTEDWTRARLNTALAPGDALYAGADSRLELQIGPRAFVRAGSDTQIGLENQEPDFVQLKVTAGQAALDVRDLAPGQTVELDTPNAAFTVERPGYYRADVDQQRTTFITRRGGRTAMTAAGGQGSEIGSGQQVIVEGTDAPSVATYAARDLDGWDRWNYDRTEAVLAAASGRYVPSGVYGADDLDHYGHWQMAPTYGRVWVPNGVSATWAPYSTGRWLWDPDYGWTWVDDAPWGWAPYHYGRWVYLSSYWAWAPGPVIVTPVYAPALVAFFGGPHFHVGIGVPFVSWVALGWGEPLVPWWGPVGFIGAPCWHGWGGPRIVNNVIVDRRTTVNVTNITYVNTRVGRAVVAVPGDRFGRGDISGARIQRVDVQQLRPVHGTLPVPHTAQAPVPSGDRARRPPEQVLSRPVVTSNRPAHPSAGTGGSSATRTGGAGSAERTHPSQTTAVERGPQSDRLRETGDRRALPPRVERQRQSATGAEAPRPSAEGSSRPSVPAPPPQAGGDRGGSRIERRESPENPSSRFAAPPPPPRGEAARRPFDRQEVPERRQPSAPSRLEGVLQDRPDPRHRSAVSVPPPRSEPPPRVEGEHRPTTRESAPPAAAEAAPRPVPPRVAPQIVERGPSARSMPHAPLPRRFEMQRDSGSSGDGGRAQDQAAPSGGGGRAPSSGSGRHPQHGR